MEFILDTAIDGLVGSLRSMAIIAMIIIPIMVFIEILRAYSVLEKTYFILQPLLKLYKLPKEAALPLMAGLIFGLTFGAGLILQAVREGHLSGRDILVINVFLALCHSLIEDTLLFVALGASAVTLISVRLVFALIITFMLVRYYDRIIALTNKFGVNKTKDMQEVNKE